VVVVQPEVSEECEERHVESPPVQAPPVRHLLLFTKPARPGRVKTRLIGDLTPAQAAELHAAFLDDLLERLRAGRFEVTLAWALDTDDEVPAGSSPGIRQRGDDLGDRLYNALSEAAEGGAAVAALGSDHPTLSVALVERAFDLLENGADAVLGPAEDGGYYLIALRAADIAWSTGRVLPATLERIAELGLRLELLPLASDVDTPADLRRLAAAMRDGDLGCPRTWALLKAWRQL